MLADLAKLRAHTAGNAGSACIDDKGAVCDLGPRLAADHCSGSDGSFATGRASSDCPAEPKPEHPSGAIGGTYAEMFAGAADKRGSGSSNSSCEVFASDLDGGTHPDFDGQAFGESDQGQQLGDHWCRTCEPAPSPLATRQAVHTPPRSCAGCSVATKVGAEDSDGGIWFP